MAQRLNLYIRGVPKPWMPKWKHICRKRRWASSRERLEILLGNEIRKRWVAWERLKSCNKYKPSCILPIPIMLQHIRSCKKQNCDRKTRHIGWDLVKALTDRRLNVKVGTQRTLVRVMWDESWMVPMCVTMAASPLGNSTIVCEISV